MELPANAPLKIIHCFRSPVGGIFRHVRDLVNEHTAAGHQLGIICDNNTGGTFEDQQLAKLEPQLALGLYRLPMERSIGPSDIGVLSKIRKHIKPLAPNIIHSHGAKGGAYARAISAFPGTHKRPATLYCPHGGSIHYDSGSMKGRVFFSLERLLERATDRLIFVSSYERDGYFDKVGTPKCSHEIVYNGISQDEFLPVATAPDATDFIYIGMMRDLKGVDLFLDALEKVSQPVSATLVGDGPDLARYKIRAKSLPDSVSVRFFDPMPARDAFGLGRAIVVPSRAESMPYIVLEALGAMQPMIATKVGGIPEIFADHSDTLVKPDSEIDLAHALSAELDGTRPAPSPREMVEDLRARFSTGVMADNMMAIYRSLTSTANSGV